MHTIVVGVDGSPPSIRALEFAAALAAATDAPTMVVVHARWLPMVWMPRNGQEEFGDLLDRAEQRVNREAERVLGHARFAWKLVCRDGEPCRVLGDIADEVDASFVVVGRRGWSAFHELLLGSVSSRIVHSSTRPVLLVP